MSDPGKRYLSYLVRLWAVDSEDKRVWRASAESPHTGERHAFADLSLLLDFLEEQTISGLSRENHEPRDARC